jgi:Right handed beta helix region
MLYLDRFPSLRGVAACRQVSNSREVYLSSPGHVAPRSVKSAIAALFSFACIVSADAATLSVNTTNAPSAVTMRVYPADAAGLASGSGSLTRNFDPGGRVWLTAPLRSGRNYFVKWQKDGLDYDAASTTSLIIDASHTLTAVYETPSCAGVQVYPGTDSLKKAVAGSPAGSTFCIKAGTHRFTSSIVARRNDKFIGEGGAILNGSKVLTSFIREGSYWVATGQTQQEPPLPTTVGGYPMCNASSPACIYPEKVFRSGIELIQVTTKSAVTPGKFYFDYANDKIYFADDPTGRVIEATTGSGGIVAYTNANQGFVTVKNLTFEKFGGGDVSGSIHNALKAVEGWQVENNEFRRISQVAVSAYGDAVLRNNYIHHNGKYQFLGSGLIEGNVASYNNLDGFDNNNDAGVTKFHGTVGMRLRGNTVSNNNTIALWADYNNRDMIYENNWIENNKGPGIFHEVSCAAIIRNNVLRGNNSDAAGRSLWWGAQIYTRSSKDLQIYGNDITAVGAGVHGISLRGGDTQSGTNCGTIELRNVSVSDNIIRMDATDFNGVVGGEAPGYGATKNIHFIGNTYYLTDLAGTYFWYDAARAPMNKDGWQGAGEDLNGRFIKY